MPESFDADKFRLAREIEDRIVLGKGCHRECSPDVVFKIGIKNPIVHSIITSWRMGQLTWDQSLCLMVFHLSEQNEQFTKLLNRKLERIDRPLVVDPPRCNCEEKPG